MGEGGDLGEVVEGWVPPARPDFAELEGRWCRLERLSADAHAATLFRAFSGQDALWDYMPVGPFHSAAQYHRWAREAEASADPLHFAILNRDTGQWGGTCSLMRIAPEAGMSTSSNFDADPAISLGTAPNWFLYFAARKRWYMRRFVTGMRNSSGSVRLNSSHSW